jgi:hypothetical protein
MHHRSINKPLRHLRIEENSQAIRAEKAGLAGLPEARPTNAADWKKEDF